MAVIINSKEEEELFNAIKEEIVKENERISDEK